MRIRIQKVVAHLPVKAGTQTRGRGDNKESLSVKFPYRNTLLIVMGKRIDLRSSEFLMEIKDAARGKKWSLLLDGFLCGGPSSSRVDFPKVRQQVRSHA